MKNDKHKEFEIRIRGWIQNEKNFILPFWKGKEEALDVILHRIAFNVMDAYRDIIQYPIPCKECGRTGNDHDSECSLGIPNLEKFSVDKDML